MCHVGRPAAAGKLIIVAATTCPMRRVSRCIVRNVFGHCAPMHLRVRSMWQRRALCFQCEGMDLGVPMTDAVAAILSRLVEVYIGLRMYTSIRAISERILLHCALTSEPGHHAS